MPEEGSKHALLPACQRCKLRKIKCDRQAPKCSSCTKSKAACIIIDLVTSERYPRDFIHRLELREQDLQAKAAVAVAARVTPVSESGAPGGSAGRSNTEEPGLIATAERTPSNQASDSPAASRGFVGDGSGLSFLRFIFHDSRWRVYEPQIMQLLAERPQIPELTISCNPQPALQEATALLDNYFARFHIHHSFLLRQDVLGIFDRVYNRKPPQPPSAQDYFRLFMVFSISAVTRYRRGDSSEHPYGYYLAAQEYVGNIPIIGNADAIQNLLLVCRFGMYHHIGTSLWEISQFCMRQCVEQNLHARPRPGNDLLKEQHQRRIFWECYISDRYSSGVLGRPFAIPENDISVELPIDAADETITDSMATGLALSNVALNSDGRPTELSVFVFCIRLRRITSRIHSAFYSSRGLSPVDGGTIPSLQVSSGHVYVLLYQFLGELETWRRAAPSFPEPRSLYERTEWYDFLLEKDKLLLVRGAIHTAPRRHHDQPPEDLLGMCLGCATRIIELYDSMARNRYITWTRGYFQVIFAAGLSIIYCVSLGLHHRGDDAAATKTRRTLQLCNEILIAFKKEMPDSGRFAVVFGILKDHYLRDPGSSLAGTHAGAAVHQQPGGPTYASNNHISDLQHILTDGDGTTTKTTTNDSSVAMDAMSRIETDISGWHQQQHQQGGDGGFMMPTGHNIFDPIRTDNMAYGEGTAFAPDHDLLGAWPTLTDEMMEHLEADLGEFAWGTQGMEGFAWDNLY